MSSVGSRSVIAYLVRSCRVKPWRGFCLDIGAGTRLAPSYSSARGSGVWRVGQGGAVGDAQAQAHFSVSGFGAVQCVSGHVHGSTGQCS